MSYRYSFIIPHRNIPLLLKRCLASIPEREDIQVIVVDDNSNDVSELETLTREAGSLELVYDKENKGAGHVRNVGLQYVKGEWVVFADADDFFDEQLLPLLDRHCADREDIVYFRAESVFCDTLSHAPKLDRRNAALDRYAGRPDKAREFCAVNCTEPWGKMIRADLIRHNAIRFDETPLANDFYFSVVAAYHARHIGFDDSRMYVYTVRPESLSYKLCVDETALKTRLSVYYGVQRFYDEHKIPYMPFYEFVFSGLFRSGGVSKSVIKGFLRSNGVPEWCVCLRYLKGKLYQYTVGVHL